MKDRAEVDAALNDLAAMLPDWLARARCDAQFWPQFDVLAGDILAGTSAREKARALCRIKTMLARNGRKRPAPDRR